MSHLRAALNTMPPYLQMRAQEERATAAAASSALARRAHLELASRYEEVATVLDSTGAVPSPLHDHDAHSFDGRAQLGQFLDRAFPLPGSGTFPDLLEAIDRAAEGSPASGV